MGDVVTALLGGETTESTRVIVTDFRLPRLFTALLVGGGLGVCGLITQTLFETRWPIRRSSVSMPGQRWEQ